MAKFFIIDGSGIITKTNNEALANKSAEDSYVIDVGAEEEIFFDEEGELGRERIEDEEDTL